LWIVGYNVGHDYIWYILIMAQLNKPQAVVVVHKGPRKNSKVKLEIFDNGTRVDDIINMRKLKPLIPKENEILDMGVGISFKEKYKKKYKIK
jgi:hypothetical protein